MAVCLVHHGSAGLELKHRSPSQPFRRQPRAWLETLWASLKWTVLGFGASSYRADMCFAKSRTPHRHTPHPTSLKLCRHS